MCVHVRRQAPLRSCLPDSPSHWEQNKLLFPSPHTLSAAEETRAGRRAAGNTAEKELLKGSWIRPPPSVPAPAGQVCPAQRHGGLTGLVVGGRTPRCQRGAGLWCVKCHVGTSQAALGSPAHGAAHPEEQERPPQALLLHPTALPGDQKRLRPSPGECAVAFAAQEGAGCVGAQRPAPTRGRTGGDAAGWHAGGWRGCRARQEAKCRCRLSRAHRQRCPRSAWLPPYQKPHPGAQHRARTPRFATGLWLEPALD